MLGWERARHSAQANIDGGSISNDSRAAKTHSWDSAIFGFPHTVRS